MVTDDQKDLLASAYLKSKWAFLNLVEPVRVLQIHFRVS